MRIYSKFVTFYSLCVATITKGWVGGRVQIAKGGYMGTTHWVGFEGRKGEGADRIRQ